MSIKRIKYIFVLAVASLVSTSCAASDVSLVQKHLDLIKSNNLREANLQYCYPKDKLWLHNLNSFKIISSVSKLVADFETPLYYTNFVIEIDTKQDVEHPFIDLARPSTILDYKQISIQIWKSDEFYQWYFQRKARNLSPYLLEHRDQINTQSSGLDNKSQANKSLLPSPTRDEINKNDLCVYMPKNQLER
jgi:hypothetical protein